jgi:hypothetical protein
LGNISLSREILLHLWEKLTIRLKQIPITCNGISEALITKIAIVEEKKQNLKKINRIIIVSALVLVVSLILLLKIIL